MPAGFLGGRYGVIGSQQTRSVEAAVELVCDACGTRSGPTEAWRCPCGGLLDLISHDVSLDVRTLACLPSSLWRYASMLPFVGSGEPWRDISMGEGWTPLVPMDTGRPRLLSKLEYCMPTGSFKDRGAAVMAMMARRMGATAMIVDSSGNAAASVAAYGRRAGLRTTAHVPAAISAGKRRQLVAYGADVRIALDRSDATGAALDHVAETRGWYAHHAVNPFAVHGTKTWVLEVWEQLGRRLPDALVMPVGNGTLLLGAYLGCRDLVSLGLARDMPRLIGVQARRCAPLARAHATGKSDLDVDPDAGPTIATGVAIPNPPRARQVLAAVRETRGTLTDVTDGRIREAVRTLAAWGLFVEPSAAVGFGGITSAADGSSAHGRSVALNELVDGDETVVVVLTGSGLKT
jgi:threonine synthase